MSVAEIGFSRGLRAAGVVLALIAAASLFAGSAPDRDRAASSAPARGLPLYFVENTGQLPAQVRYQSQGAASGIYFMPDHVRFVVQQGTAADAIDLGFAGASADTRPEARGRMAARVTHIDGSARDGSSRTLPTHREIVYRNVWPKVDVVFIGAESRLEYSFVLHPGAEPSDVRLTYRGAEGIHLNRDGDLVVSTPDGAFADARPHAYSVMGGRKREVASRFSLASDAAFGFDVGAYDRSRTLIVDPGLAYSALFGPGDPFGVAVDRRGRAYVYGETFIGYTHTNGWEVRGNLVSN